MTPAQRPCAGGEDIPMLGRGTLGGKGNDKGAGSCCTVLLGPMGLWLLSPQPGAWQGVDGWQHCAWP